MALAPAAVSSGGFGSDEQPTAMQPAATATIAIALLT